MWPLLVFAVALVLIPILTGGLSWSSRAESLLEASFARQRPIVHGAEVPATSLRVLHRWRTHVMSGNQGGLYEIDANWLCRTPDGLFVVAIGQGEPDWSKATFLSLRRPFEIRWTWRSLSKERVRQLLTATPDVYRDVFGEHPAAPH